MDNDDQQVGTLLTRREMLKLLGAANVDYLVPDRVVDGYGLTAPCLLYTSPSPRDRTRSRMPSSA